MRSKRLSKAQREIIALADKSGRITKKRCVEALSDKYYTNSEKYIGERLSAMVRAGILKRTKPGYFILKHSLNSESDQTELFS